MGEGNSQEQQKGAEGRPSNLQDGFIFPVTSEVTPVTAGLSSSPSLGSTHGVEQQNGSPHPATIPTEAEQFTDFALNG